MRKLKKRSGIKMVSVYKVLCGCSCSCACMGNGVIWNTTVGGTKKSHAAGAL